MMKRLVPLVASLVIAELFLVILGYPTNADRGALLPGSVTPDSLLGWKHLPVTLTSYADSSSKPFRVTFWPDGSRATRKSFAGNTSPRAILLGCSFTEGFGLDDSETIAWRFQAQRPELSVVNLGTGGYGSYQSFLRLQQYLRDYPPTPNSPIAHITYLFADFHTWRNIRNPQSQRYWESPGIYPVCSYNQKLECSNWSGKKPWSLSQYLRLSSLVENAIDTYSVQQRKVEAIQVTRSLIASLRDFGAQAGIPTDVALIVSADGTWPELLSKDAVRFTDCTSAELSDQSAKLPDGHPNARGASLLASCLERIIP